MLTPPALWKHAPAGLREKCDDLLRAEGGWSYVMCIGRLVGHQESWFEPAPLRAVAGYLIARAREKRPPVLDSQASHDRLGVYGTMRLAGSCHIYSQLAACNISTREADYLALADILFEPRAGDHSAVEAAMAVHWASVVDSTRQTLVYRHADGLRPAQLRSFALLVRCLVGGPFGHDVDRLLDIARSMSLPEVRRYLRAAGELSEKFFFKKMPRGLFRTW